MKKKVLATLVAGSFLLAGVACDKSDATETTTSATIASTTEATEATEETTSETSESVSTDPLNETYVYSGKYTKAQISDIYSMYRTKAGDIYANLDGKPCSFGYVINESNEEGVLWEYVLVVYDKENGITAFHEVDGSLEQLSDFELSEEDAELILMPYDRFMDYPCLSNFYAFKSVIHNGFDANKYVEKLPDGNYSGITFGVSGDAAYLYAGVAKLPDLSVSAKECLSLKEGDTVTLGGERYSVTAVNTLENGQTSISVSDGADNLFAIVISTPDEARIASYGGYNFTAYGFDDGSANFVRIPIASDCVIEIISGSNKQPSVLDVEGFRAYLGESAVWAPELIGYEQGGFGMVTFETTHNMPCYGLLHNVQIENGEIVYMAFDIT